jgi:hypothetical protein
MQERDVILGRILTEFGILLSCRNGLTIRELTDRLRSVDPGLDFNERTIRRDCLAFEYHGLVEPRGEEDTGTWKVRATPQLDRWFPQGLHRQPR